MTLRFNDEREHHDDVLPAVLGGMVSRRDLIRRGIALGLGASVLAGLLAACADDDDEPDDEPPATDTDDSADEEPADEDEDEDEVEDTDEEPPAVTDDEIIIAQANDVVTLDPQDTQTYNTDLSVISHIYTPLLQRDQNLEFEPMLATSWESGPDTVWTFQLRDDITFPNGEVLDAEVAKWNLDRVLDPDQASRIAGHYAPVTDVRAVDATTLEVETSAPYPTLIAHLSSFYLLAPEWTEDHDPAGEAMGSGPYELEQWIRDDHIALVRRDDYWGDPMPFQRVVFRAVPESSSRVSGLLAGDFDIISPVPPADFSRIEGGGQARAGAVGSTRIAMVRFNPNKEPFTDPVVRRAFNYAVDKQALVDTFFEGLDVGISQGQVLNEAYFGFNPALEPYPYDPEEAQRLLDEAGFTGDIELELSVPQGRYLLGEEITQAVAHQLEQIGATVTYVEEPFAIWLDRLVQDQDMTHLTYLTYANPTLDADGLLQLFEPPNPHSYWTNEEFKQAVVDGRSTLVESERLEHYARATEIMREEALVLFMFPQPATFAAVNDVEWTIRPDDWVRVWEMRRTS